jgi:UDP-N-acetylmuramoyl-L-alanyl-D-glutamate--2,6-diaminopimelate ligase
LTSAEPGEAAPMDAMHEYLDGFEKSGRAHVMPSRRRAIEFALAQARPGDAVLIAGRNDLGQAVEGNDESRRSDREIACEWLYGKSSTAECRRFRIVG